MKKCILTKNDCYTHGTANKNQRKPTGIMFHSTGANNPALARYIQSSNTTVNAIIGTNRYNNDWNRSGIPLCVHAFIGKEADGTVETYQTLPWEYVGWHSGAGTSGKAANYLGYIGFEVCEDDLTDSTYFNAIYNKALDLCVYLCKTYDISVENVISHAEGYRQGIASNHSDVDHWFRIMGTTMTAFRTAIQAKLDNPEEEKTWWTDAHEFATETGLSDGTRPYDNTTRAEQWTMFDRFRQIYKLDDVLEKLGISRGTIE